MWVEASGGAGQGGQGLLVPSGPRQQQSKQQFQNLHFSLYWFTCFSLKTACLLKQGRQGSHFAFDIAAMAYSGVSACSDSSAFKFVLDTVCLLHFTLHLPIIYSHFIYQNLLTFSDLPLPTSPTHIFLSIAVVAYSYTQPPSALNVSCHDPSFSSYPILSNNIYAE